MKGIILALSLALSVSPAVASGVAPISVKQEPKNYTPIPNGDKQAQAWGYVCRNGVWYCVMSFGGPVGMSCCGCGFCGWWSLW